MYHHWDQLTAMSYPFRSLHQRLLNKRGKEAKKGWNSVFVVRIYVWIMETTPKIFINLSLPGADVQALVWKKGPTDKGY